LTTLGLETTLGGILNPTAANILDRFHDYNLRDKNIDLDISQFIVFDIESVIFRG
jgi:hypothetical protein